jgi:hypothetical protein
MFVQPPLILFPLHHQRITRAAANDQMHIIVVA